MSICLTACSPPKVSFHPSLYSWLPSSPSLLRTTIWSLDICICFCLIWFVHLVGWLVGWFFIIHMSQIIWEYSFSVSLISLSIILSRSTHIVANGNISSFLYLMVSNLYIHTMSSLASQVDLGVKNLPANVGEAGDTVSIRKIPWRRKGQPSPVFLPGKSYGQRSQVGYSPGGHKESDMTEWLNTHVNTHVFFNRSSLNGHLGYFHIFAIVNNAVMNIGRHVLLQIKVFVFG